MSGRSNQRARTRAALLDAATQLVREGRPPSIPDAADLALVSVATAYRYFPSADQLWLEASDALVEWEPTLAESNARIEAAGDDVMDRLEAAIQAVGFRMIDDQAPYRRVAQSALDQWFSAAHEPHGERPPVREQRRKAQIELVLAPLRGSHPDVEVDRIAHALGVVIGTDAMLAVTDGVGLEGDDAKAAMLDAGRWLLAGALRDLESSTRP